MRQDALAMRVRDQARGQQRPTRERHRNGALAGRPSSESAQDPFAQDELARSEATFLTEAREELTRDGNLFVRVGGRLDRDAGSVAHESNELLVDVRVLLYLGDLDRVRLLELREPRLDRLGNDFVVDTVREHALGPAPDRHEAECTRAAALPREQERFV